MKHLRIENNKGQYSIDGKLWLDLEVITKDDLLKLVDLALDDEYLMDDYEKEKLPNPAQEIIYRNIFTKLSELVEKKERFKDESQQYYKEALLKYRSEWMSIRIYDIVQYSENILIFIIPDGNNPKFNFLFIPNSK